MHALGSVQHCPRVTTVACSWLCASPLDAYEDAVERRAKILEAKRHAEALLAENPDAVGALSLAERERARPADQE